MVSDKNLERLKTAIGALNEGDPIPFAALSPLSEIARDGVDVSIDYAAQKHLGAPVIVAQPRSRTPDLSHLSPRRRAVAELILAGLSNKAIAAELDLAVGTVKDHVHAVLKTCECSSRTEFMALLHGA